jgi:acetyl esterase
MPLDPQFCTILDNLEAAGAVPLVRGDAMQTRAHYRKLSLNGEGYFLTRHDMTWFYEQYLPAGVTNNAEADLAHADVAGVAPAIVATAEFDPLRDEGAAYAGRLKNAGVPTEYVPGPGLIHGYAAFLGLVDAADATAATVLGSLSRTMRMN